MTPDLPIPDQVLGELARILWRRCPSMLTKQAEEATVEMIAATLPHLRSLQVETQVRAGRLLGLEEAAKAVEGYFEDPHCEGEPCEDCSLVRELAAIIRSLGQEAPEATSEPRTDLPVGPSHPQDSQTAREAL